MDILNADLGTAGQKKAAIINAKNHLYDLIEAIKKSIDELHPYLSGNVTDSSFQKLEENIATLQDLESFVNEYTVKAGGVINAISAAIERMKNRETQ